MSDEAIITSSTDQIWAGSVPNPPDDPAPDPTPPPDDEIDRILAMSDEEILAEARADGIDTDKQAREMAAQFDVIARLVRERDQARELLGRSWLRNARQSRENKRAVALLHAVERLNRHAEIDNAHPFFGTLRTDYHLLPQQGSHAWVAVGRHQMSTTCDTIADALIALAAQLEVPE